MCQQCQRGPATDRRHFLRRTASVLGAAGMLGLFPLRQGANAAAAGASGAVDQAHPASATALRRALPALLPIPGSGFEGPHAFLPGPEGSTTPFSGLPGMGLDIEPSTMTDFNGFTAFAIVAGQAEGSDGKTYNVESDLRVMAGEYVVEDGSRHQGTFAFF